MNWKVFKNQIKEDPAFYDESKFIIGIDIGTSSAKVGWYNKPRREAELMDSTGGYGNSAVPVVLQYIPETKEWVYGEYALLNKGYFNDVTIPYITKKLGMNEYLDIDGKMYSVPALLGKYLKYLIEFCKNINPNAQICGIMCAIPTYYSHQAREELEKAFTYAGYQKEFMGFTDERECVLKQLQEKYALETKEKILLLDYGFDALTGTILEHNGNNDFHVLSSVFEERAGTQKIDKRLRDLFALYYCQEFEIKPGDLDKEHFMHIENLVYQNKSILFHHQLERNVKVYYNFCYPPFQKEVSKEILQDVLRPIKNAFFQLISRILEKAIPNPLTGRDLSKIICCGGGFHMDIVKTWVESLFPGIEVIVPGQLQGIACLGACLKSAEKLGILPEVGYRFTDLNVVQKEIVVAVKSKDVRYVPVIEKNSFWWEKRKPLYFLLGTGTKDAQVGFYVKKEDGAVALLEEVALSDFPDRPKKATKLKLDVSFEKYNVLRLRFQDMGFGEIFPSDGYEKSITLQLS